MFDVQNVNLHFGERHVLRDATFKVEDGERAAIIGPNGAGKSTLLKIIAGILSPESGRVAIPKTQEIGYLPQEVILDTPLTVEEECRTVFQEVLDHEKEMRDIENRMSDGTVDHDSPEYTVMAERYDYLLHETMRRDIYSMDSTIGKVLSGLGFSPEDMKRPCREFSGGWQMRIALGKILLANPDVLLLDEPTNHLDIESIEWLGDWLSNHEGSVLMVSHERSFMDKLVNKVVEVDRGRVIVYRGNYTISLEKRAERRENQQRAFENQQLEISHLQKFIDRFRYQASKAALVQSRIKQLERLVIIEEPTPEQDTIHFKFPPAPRSGKEVIVAENISKRFGDNQVLDNVDFQMYRGEKVALVGHNGAGKTTLMKILASKLAADSGSISLGSSVDMQYFAQYDHEDLHPSNTVLGEFLSIAPLSISDKARAILGAFLFSGDDVQKNISVLSGGEKTRLRLARMLCGSANLLMLDEPTNHLDIGSRLTLESALRQYEGAVVLVSHDRYFLDNVVTRVVEIANGTATSYPGTYSDYLHMKAMQEAATGRTPKPVVAVPAAIEPQTPTAQPDQPKQTAAPADRKRMAKDLSKLEKQVESAEGRMAELDEVCRALENEMHDPAVARDADKLMKLTAKLEQTRQQLAEAEEQWTELQLKAEELKEELAGV